VFQRTWVGVVERIGTLNRPESLASWIASTARHHTYQLFDEARRAGRVPVWDGAEDEALRREATVEPAEDDLLALERLELLREAVAALDPRCRRLIELLFLTEPRPDYRTIASRTGLAVGSIGPIRARCLEKLRRTMERLYQGDVSPDSLEDER
jgi:RNA polymerase sigma factor (sigma-70 family)